MNKKQKLAQENKMKNPIKMVQNTIGSMIITKKEDLDSLESQIDSATTSLNMYTETDFDKNLKVDVPKQGMQTNYNSLARDTKLKLQKSFDEFKQTMLNNEALTQNSIEQSSEGKVGNTDFLCFAEIDNSGKIVSTIIVTEDSARKTQQNADGSYSYQQVKRTKNGMEVLVNTSNSCLHMKGAYFSQEEIENIKNFADKVDVDLTRAPKLNNIEEIKKYTDTLDALGVDQNIDIADKDHYAKMAFGATKPDKTGSTIYKGMSCIYNKDKNFDKPESISISVQKDNKYSNKSFRRTANGQYIDCTSFKLVNGKPEYSLVSLDEIKEIARGQGLNVTQMDKFEKFNKEDKDLVPQAELSIHNATVKQYERSREQQLETDNASMERR